MVAIAPSKRELEQEKAEIVQRMEDLHNLASNEKRGFTDDEQSKWDADDKALVDVNSAIERCNKLAQEAATFAPSDEQCEDESRSRFESQKRSFKDSNDDPKRPLTSYEKNCALRFWAMGRFHEYPDKARDAELFERLNYNNEGSAAIQNNRLKLSLTRPEEKVPQTLSAVRSQAQQRKDAETRAVNQVGTASLGGNTVPDEMMPPLEEAMLHFGGMRQVSQILSTSTGGELPMPTENDTAQTGELIANETTAVGEQALTFGQIVLNHYTYSSKMIPVSWLLMQDSVVNLPNLIGRRAGERIGRITNAHFTTGTGTGQPNGIVTAAADSSVTTSGATAISHDNLIDLEHSVDIAYRGGATYMFNDDTLKILKKLKDSNGLPLWVPSTRENAPGTINGYTYQVNNDMPTGASSKAVLFGQLSKYIIREIKGITLVRLDERYAEFLRTGFFAYARYDGDLLDAGTNPVKFLTLGA